MKYSLLVTSLLLSAVFTCRAFQANDVAQTVLSDGSYSDTSKAAAYALGKGQDGWALTVGAAGGSYTWTNVLVLGTTNLFTIQGASTNNRATIIFNTTASSGLYVNSSGNLVTIRNFIFNTGASRPYLNLVAITGTGVCFRVSNCEFVSASQMNFGMQVGNINAISAPGPFGLVDNCQFYFPGGPVYNYIQVRANGNVNGYPWTQAMSWGTVNSVVVENCAFSQPHAAPLSGLVEADGGARLTIRYNLITNIPESTHGIASGAHESTLQVECYGNHWVLNDTNNTMPYVFWQRGGTTLIWSNVVSTTSYWNLGKAFLFTEECAQSANWQAESCSQLLTYPFNYPGQQQVGQGVVNGAQGTVPIYCWGNTIPGTYYGTFTLGLAEDSAFIAQGRDIFTNSPMPGYTALVYPHPLVASGGTSPGSFPTNGTGSGTVIPPTDLQAHPPAGQ